MTGVRLAFVVILASLTTQTLAVEEADQRRQLAHRMAHCAGIADMLPHGKALPLDSHQMNAFAGVALSEFYPDSLTVLEQLTHSAHNSVYLLARTPLDSSKLAKVIWKDKCTDLHDPQVWYAMGQPKPGSTHGINGGGFHRTHPGPG